MHLNKTKEESYRKVGRDVGSILTQTLLWVSEYRTERQSQRASPRTPSPQTMENPNPTKCQLNTISLSLRYLAVSSQSAPAVDQLVPKKRLGISVSQAEIWYNFPMFPSKLEFKVIQIVA